LEEQQSVLAAVRVPDGFKIMQSWHPNDRNCCWQAAAVTATGDSVGCMYLREYVDFGNIRATPLLDTWRNNELYRSLREGEVESSCPSCHDKDGTHGGCRSTAYAFHGRFDAPDPFCSHLNDGVDLRVLPQRLLQENS
jgi:radical SAM protein with 4Fe4S-binding SPASM domain